MTSDRRTVHKADARLEPVAWLSEAVRRRARSTLLRLDEKSAKQNQALARQLMALRLEYRRSLSALMGAGGMRRYRELRGKLAKAPRSQRIRESGALLDDIGFDRVRADRLRKRYLDTARKLLRFDDVRIPPLGGVLDTPKSPWVTYTAPYGGDFWSLAWHRSDEASNPVLARHLDRVTGRIGSSIETRLSGADDDDALEAEYYTALNTWHTALATGPLEGYLAFEFRTSNYSGQVSDEFGFSNATFSQLARARLRVVDAQGASDTQESRIFVFIDTDWGDGTSWSNFVAAPRDLHWYYFKTATSFAQGSALLLEAGVWNMTWFCADDESIQTAAELDLRLDRIMVRSCP
jgi:hypothetical protein